MIRDDFLGVGFFEETSRSCCAHHSLTNQRVGISGDGDEIDKQCCPHRLLLMLHKERNAMVTLTMNSTNQDRVSDDDDKIDVSATTTFR
ncbi:hypothetical protein U1Q18_021941 [Sarracenia purpurea var. burkii]